MNEKKLNDYKVSWGSEKSAFEMWVHIVLAIGIVYAVYSFFHQMGDDNAEKTKAGETEKEDQASGGYRINLENLNPKSPANASSTVF